MNNLFLEGNLWLSKVKLKKKTPLNRTQSVPSQLQKQHFKEMHFNYLYCPLILEIK